MSENNKEKTDNMHEGEVDEMHEKNPAAEDAGKSGEGESSALEEEDLDLIKENLGRAGFRRLQRRQNEDGPQLSFVSPVTTAAVEESSEDDVAAFRGRKRVAAEELEKLFEDDDSSALTPSSAVTPINSTFDSRKEKTIFTESEEDDLADFIEDEEEEVTSTRGAPSRIGEEKRKGSKKAYLLETFGDKLPGRAIQDILDIFGDGTDYLGLVDEDDEDEVMAVEEAGEKNKKNKAPSNAASNKISILREIDVPERELLRDGKERASVDSSELEREAAWIQARWMQDRALAERFSSSDAGLLLAAISAVLLMLREQHLEVPVIATHRKEYFQHLLSLNDLWSIWDLDEQWKVLQKQRSILLSELNSIESASFVADDELLLKQALEVADSLDVLGIFGDFLRFLKKRRTDQDLASFSLTPAQFYKNAQHQSLLHSPPSISEVDIQVSNPIVALADYLGKHPLSHLVLRFAFEPDASITVTPTGRGLVEITAQHEMEYVKWITDKPLAAFLDDQFLLLLKGQSLGLLNISVTFPRKDATLEQLEGFFVGTSSSYSVDEIRRGALKRALNDHVLPRLSRDLQAKLKAQGETYVASGGQYSLQDKLMVRPYDPSLLGHPIFPQSKSSSAVFKVISIVLDPNNSGVAAVVLDEKGRVLEQARLTKISYSYPPHQSRAMVKDESTLAEGDWEKLIELVSVHMPSCALIGGRTLATRDLFRDFEKCLEEEKSLKRPIPLLYGDDDTAKIYSDSTRGKQEWPDSPNLIRYGISLGRRFLNPIFEFSGMTDEELGHLDPHPLQGFVSLDHILNYKKRAFVNVINLVGVDLNAAIQSSWMRSPLKYVCGLGTIKGESLIRAVVSSDENNPQVKRRRDILRFLGPVVYANCASFLRIRFGFSGPRKSLPEDPLDDTRIHPENYVLARKMAADALEINPDEDAEDDPEEAASRAVSEVMTQPERLNDLLLDEYAKELAKRGQPSKHLTLLDIKAELQNPYAELRQINRGPEPGRLFEILTGETEKSLWEGLQLTLPVIKGFSPGDRRIACMLPSGVPAFLPDRPSTPLRPGQQVTVIIRSIDVERMGVEVMEASPGSVPPGRYRHDYYYDASREGEVRKDPRGASSAEATRTAISTSLAAPPKRKIISHPSFRDVSRSQAEELLAKAMLGEVIIRPSGSRGHDHLSLTWKIDDDHGRVALFQHLDVQEMSTPKVYRIVGLGSEDTFEDLDEIIARYIEPIAAFLRDVRLTPKFIALTQRDRQEARGEIEAYLASQRRADPSRIAYCLSLSRDRPGSVHISYQPSSKAYHELVDVSPAGFSLRGQKFDKVESMIAWFKQNHRSISTQTIPTAMATSIAPNAGGGSRRDYDRHGRDPSASTGSKGHHAYSDRDGGPRFHRSNSNQRYR